MALHWNLILNENSGPHNGVCSNCRGILPFNSCSYQDQVSYNEEWHGVMHLGKFVSNARYSKSINVNWNYDGSDENCVIGLQ